MRIVGFRIHSARGNVLSTSFRMPGETGSKNLFRAWSGEQWTAGQAFHFRYQLIFSGNGPDAPKLGVSYCYSYSVTQASPQSPVWTLTQEGRFVLRASESNLWHIRMDLYPSQESEAPPSEEARIALVKLAGLPDNLTRSFRIRDGGESLDFQSIDADPTDQTDRVWHVRTNESPRLVRCKAVGSTA